MFICKKKTFLKLNSFNIVFFFICIVRKKNETKLNRSFLINFERIIFGVVGNNLKES